ncbi:hypothetical protein K474DRAFT_606231 [Panus rudis PR-1116 ss-1]|nr:hypothetical protein K474DRAFT_606231 [Panus rudis PR-1116 ss-1]
MPEAAIPSPASLLGGCVLSIFISLILYGLVLAQTYIYLLTFNRDPKWLKRSVMALCFFETTYTVCIIHWLYHMAITGFGNLSIVDILPWSAPTSLILEVIIAVMCQSQYLRRLWILSNKNMWLIAPIAILMVFRFGVGMATVAFLFNLGRLSAFQTASAPKATVDAANYIQCTADALIAGSLIYYLHRNKSGIAKTDGTVRWIIQYLVNTGAVTMSVSLGIAITFIVLPNNLVFAGLFTIVSRLYANAFLGTLNGQQILRKRARHIITSTSDYYSTYIEFEPANDPRLPDSGQSRSSDIPSRTIEIYKEVVAERDSGSTKDNHIC